MWNEAYALAWAHIEVGLMLKRNVSKSETKRLTAMTRNSHGQAEIGSRGPPQTQ
jgi:hypothetical protein